MIESVRTNPEEFMIISIPPKGNNYQTPAHKRLKILQNSEKNSWLGVDIQSIGKVGTKGYNQPSLLAAFNKKTKKYLQDNSSEDTRPPLINFIPVNEDQICKDPGPTNIYSKGSLYQHKDLLYRIYKTDARLVRSILENSGFSSTDSHDWNLLWVGSSAQSYLYEGLNEYQKINHFPNSFELTRKDKMHINLSSMVNNHGKDDYNFVPETYLLPDQYNEFYSQYCKNKQTTWIHKPCGSSQGKGIFLLNSLNDIPANEPCIVSKYIPNPLLINDLKFDVRIYVLVSSFDPLRIYIYDEGLARFASEAYNPTNKSNRFSHLTNYSVNKKNDKFIQNQDWRQDNYGHKWSLAALSKALEPIGVDTSLLWTKIYDIIIKSIISIEPIVLESLRNLVVHRNNCFDLFGFDVLIDSDLKPWLLEVNLSPSLATDSSLDLHIKSNLIADTFNLIGVRGFDRKKESVNKVKARIKARQIKLSRERKKIANTMMGFSEVKQPKYSEIFKETLEEYERRGHFLRIYPAKGCDHYERFFTGVRHNNKALYKFLYNDLWESDIPRPLNSQSEGSSASKLLQSDDKSVISFEAFLIEYLDRVTHILKKIPDEIIKQDWKTTIQKFYKHNYWGSPLKQFLISWQQIEERSNELKKMYLDDKQISVLKSLSASELEIMMKSYSKPFQSELLNCLFINNQTGVLCDLIKFISAKTYKKKRFRNKKKTKEEENSINE